MPQDNQHLLEICSKMSNETDADKMAELVRELNQELLDKKKDVQSSPKTASDLPRPA